MLLLLTLQVTDAGWYFHIPPLRRETCSMAMFPCPTPCQNSQQKLLAPQAQAASREDVREVAFNFLTHGAHQPSTITLHAHMQLAELDGGSSSLRLPVFVQDLPGLLCSCSRTVCFAFWEDVLMRCSPCLAAAALLFSATVLSHCATKAFRPSLLSMYLWGPWPGPKNSRN